MALGMASTLAFAGLILLANRAAAGTPTEAASNLRRVAAALSNVAVRVEG